MDRACMMCVPVRRAKNFSILCSPNEDFGRLNKALRMRFWTSFQPVVAQNEYSHPWKVLQKRTRNALFIRPKSSFGEHKVAPSKTNPLWIPSFLLQSVVKRCPQNDDFDSILVGRDVPQSVQDERTLAYVWYASLFYKRKVPLLTKILDGWTKRYVCVFEIRLKGVRKSGFGDLGDWFSHPPLKSTSRTHFSYYMVLDEDSLKSASKMTDRKIFRRFQIFVWDFWKCEKCDRFLSRNPDIVADCWTSIVACVWWTRNEPLYEPRTLDEK